MRGKQRPAAVDVVQMLQRGPGNRQPVIGGRAAPDFVQNDQRPVIGLVQDRRRFDHFDHEGRPPPRQIIRRADPAEQLADQPDLRRLAPAQSCPSAPAARSARSAAERSISPPCSARSAARSPACSLSVSAQSLATNGPAALPPQRPLHHRMPPARHVKGPAVIDHRLDPVFGHRQIGQGRRPDPFPPAPAPQPRSGRPAPAPPARRLSKCRFSISSAWLPAFRIRVSSSLSATVVNRT